MPVPASARSRATGPRSPTTTTDQQKHCPLTSSSPSRAEDSFCKTAMSRREDIVSCIDVTIVDRSAHSALPSSYSKIFPAFGAGAAVTHAAGLGGKRFIDFIKPHACVIALVQQPGSKCAPARILHQLGLSERC